MRTQQPRSKRSRGQILIMTTLVLVPMFGVLGLVTDFGYMHFVKMSAQTAAEAAAQAAIIDFHASVGGSNFSCGGSIVCSDSPTDCAANITTPSNSIERGCLYAKQHGFQTSGNQRVTYQSGVGGTPPTAPGMGTTGYWVTYRVVQRVPQMFSAVLGNTSGLVAARSTAAVTGANDCIYALNPNASGAVSVGGTASLTSSCGIFDNSNNGCALSTNGNSVVLSAPEYDVVGQTCTQNPLTPSPNTGVAPTSDPLASLPAPASAPYTCDYKNFSAPNWTNPTLSPGVYCGGIQVKNNNYTLSPGNYILVGGGLTTQDSNSNISGTGVMFYNTFGSTDKGNQSYSPINIAATSTVSLKAPTSGTYSGILFFDDRNAPTGNPDNYGGGSTAVYEGTIYARNNSITLYGNSSVTSKYTMIVADQVNLIGTSGINNDYSSLPGGSPIQKVVVVE